MSSRAASPRVLVLAAVVAAHAGALLTLLAETRTRLVRGDLFEHMHDPDPDPEP
jgi:hypothetical protein